MKKLTLLLMLFGTFWLSAQDAPATVFHVFEYMDVKPGMNAEYLQVEKAWSKIHEANIKAGKYVGWELSVVAFPIDEERGYDFVVRTIFKDSKQLGEHMDNWAFPEGWENLLTEEERLLVEETEDYRTMVRSEVWTVVDMAAGPTVNDAKVAVFNFFDSPEGKSTSDHFEVEKTIWKPIHEARIADGGMQGWVLGVLELPWGSDYPYDSGTVDIYNSTQEYLDSSIGMGDYFAKVHEGKAVADLFEQTEANSNLVRSEIRRIVYEIWNE